MWATLFSLTNGIAMFGWLLLAALPRRPLVTTTVLYLGVALLCLTYAVMFALLFSASVDPGLVAGAKPADIRDYSIPGIRALFQSDGGIVLGWTHYMAFDLFVGLWIAKDADAKGFSRIIQLPILFATLMAGPIGLLLWLMIREGRARKLGRPN